VAAIRTADADYFRAMRIPLLAGRGFEARDVAGAPPVVLVSEDLAGREWPGQSPIGKRIQVDYWHPEEVLEVIGVVGNVLHEGLDHASRETIYYAMTQHPTGSFNVVLRGAGRVQDLLPPLTAAVHGLDPSLPLEGAMPLADRIGGSLAGRKASLQVVAIFAAIAVVLAGIGIYGVLSQIVRLRRREIGIRLALGSTPGREVGSVMSTTARLVVLGALGGVLGAVAAGATLRAFLYEVPSNDPITYVVVLFALATIALLAGAVPARRAARVDPVVALRAE
jgi:putative ABC transport system permease protein